MLGDDDIKPSTRDKIEKQGLLNELSTLKELIFVYLEMPFEEIKKIDPDIDNYLKINEFFDKKLLQLGRLSMVIEPEYQLYLNPHSKNDNKYVIFRGLYLDKDFRKSKISSVSLGNVENHGGSVKLIDENLINQLIVNLVKELELMYRQEYS